MTSPANVTPVSLYSKNGLLAVGYPTHNSVNAKIYWGEVLLSSAPNLSSAIYYAYFGIRTWNFKYLSWLTPELRLTILKELQLMSSLIDNELYRNREGMQKNFKLGSTRFLDELTKVVFITTSLVKNNPINIFETSDDIFELTVGYEDLRTTYNFKRTYQTNKDNIKENIFWLLSQLASTICKKNIDAARGNTRIEKSLLETVEKVYSFQEDNYDDMLKFLSELPKKAKALNEKITGFYLEQETEEQRNAYFDLNAESKHLFGVIPVHDGMMTAMKNSDHLKNPSTKLTKTERVPQTLHVDLVPTPNFSETLDVLVDHFQHLAKEETKK